MKIIAHVYSDFTEKFGTPRQSGLIDEVTGRIIFEPEYRNKDAIKGLEEFSHLWILWQFSESIREKWSPTVRPPRLGGNTYMGVFATRSPFRPNPIGLSSVKLVEIIPDGKNGPEIIVSGVDMMNGTPIYDIKPYLAYTDSHPEAVCGFADRVKDYSLKVNISEELNMKIPQEKRAGLVGILSQDPRPGYKRNSDRIFGISYAGMNVKFTVNGETLTVVEICK